MNKQRRKELQVQVDIITEIRNKLELLMEAEQTAFDNLPEGLQMSEKGEQMEQAVSNLEEAITSLDDVNSLLEDTICN